MFLELVRGQSVVGALGFLVGKKGRNRKGPPTLGARPAGQALVRYPCKPSAHGSPRLPQEVRMPGPESRSLLPNRVRRNVVKARYSDQACHRHARCAGGHLIKDLRLAGVTAQATAARRLCWHCLHSYRSIFSLQEAPVPHKREKSKARPKEVRYVQGWTGVHQ